MAIAYDIRVHLERLTQVERIAPTQLDRNAYDEYLFLLGIVGGS